VVSAGLTQPEKFQVAMFSNRGIGAKAGTILPADFGLHAEQLAFV
jgi:hypothetical protein